MKRAFILFSVFLTLTASPLVRAESAPLTDQYIASIRAGCSDALQGILQVQRTEAATRVNRGREYETLLRLMAAFNSRVVLNKLDVPTLTGTSARMQGKFADFQKHYLEYADTVDATLKVNCKVAPVTFYDNLTATRDARAKVASDVREIDDLLNEYQKGLDTLKTDLSKAELGVQR
jgi:hypothetical protein